MLLYISHAVFSHIALVRVLNKILFQNTTVVQLLHPMTIREDLRVQNIHYVLGRTSPRQRHKSDSPLRLRLLEITSMGIVVISFCISLVLRLPLVINIVSAI